MKKTANSAISVGCGRLVDILNPDLSEMTIPDIARSLSQICRYTGLTYGFYSVAQHSVIVSNLVPEEYALQGLLHDAHEAIIGDISSPLKNALSAALGDFNEKIDRPVREAMRKHLGIPAEMHATVEHADMVALVTEQRDLMFESHDRLLQQFKPMDEKIKPMDPFDARLAFLLRYRELTGFDYSYGCNPVCCEGTSEDLSKLEIGRPIEILGGGYNRGVRVVPQKVITGTTSDAQKILFCKDSNQEESASIQPTWRYL